MRYSPAASAGSLDPQNVPLGEPQRHLGLEGTAVQEIRAGRPVCSALRAVRAVSPALGEQRGLHRLERLELPDDAVATHARTLPAAAGAERVGPNAHRML